LPGQNFLTSAAGKLFSNDTLSKKLRSVAQPLMRYRQFTDKESQYGKRSGEKLLFDKILNVAADVTSGAVIAEGQPIPRTGFDIVQGEAIAKPSGVAVPWTEELESFSEFDVRSPIESRLVDHMAKSLDYRAYSEFNATNVAYTPTGTTASPTEAWQTDGLATTASASRDVQVYDLKNVIDGLKKGNYNGAASAPVPPYDGVNFMCIGSVDFCRALKDDSEWEKAQYYGDPEKLFSGECGRIYGCRVIEDNHILSTINGKKGGAFFFGSEAVMEVVATAEEVRVGIPGDFGRDMAMAWYYLGGFKLIWDYNATTEPDNRVVGIKSA
jgi:N4-gp56 family major capsid protein